MENQDEKPNDIKNIVPVTSPFDVDSAVRLGWKAFTDNAVPLIIGLVIAAVISMVTLGLAGPVMWLGYSAMALKSVRGEPVEIGDVFSGMSFFFPALILGLVIGLGVCLGLLCFLLPGIYLIVIWEWVFFLMADGTQGVGDSLKLSKDISKSDLSAAFVIILVGMVIDLSGTVVPLGSLITTPIAMCVSAVAYDRWRKQNG